MIRVFVVDMMTSASTCLRNYLKVFDTIILVKEVYWRRRRVLFMLFYHRIRTIRTISRWNNSICFISCNCLIIFSWKIGNIISISKFKLIIKILHQCWPYMFWYWRYLILLKPCISLNGYFYSWIIWKFSN
jgi:hypothetical protein